MMHSDVVTHKVTMVSRVSTVQQVEPMENPTKSPKRRKDDKGYPVKVLNKAAFVQTIRMLLKVQTVDHK